MQTQEKMDIIAKTYLGLEEILKAEIIALGGEKAEIINRGVKFRGDKRMLYKANFGLRTAVKVLKVIDTFNAEDTDALYERVKKVDWSAYLDVKKTFAIEAVVYSETFKHSKFVAYRVKDAIADRFVERQGRRPNVSVEDPDVRIHIHISHNKCTLALDASGESLHKRGWRTDQTEAPLSEVLAAGMILKSGWTGTCDFMDPMCGSGTLLVEAALIGTGTAPGLYRRNFAFEKWDDYDREIFDEIYNDTTGEKDFEHVIYGADRARRAVEIAEANLKSAGMKRYVKIDVRDLKDLKRVSDKGVMITNPPYGERLKIEDMEGLYETLGRKMKHELEGWDAWVISSRKDALAKIGLKPSEKIKLLNGDIECEYRHYELFGGKRKEHLKTRKA